MTSWWEDYQGRPIRRIRGGGIAAPASFGWRDQPRGAVEQGPQPQFIDLQAPAAPTARRLGLGIDADGGFAFLLATILLFPAPFGAVTAAAFALTVFAYLRVRRRDFVRVMAPRSFLLIVPTFAFLAIIWSQAPKDTFRYALELGLAVLAGGLLSSARRPEFVLRGLTLALLVSLCGALAFAGLAQNQGLLAHTASIGVLVSFVVTLMAARGRHLTWAAVGLAGLALAAYLVIIERSVEALLGLALGLGTLAVLLPLLATGKVLRGWLTAIVGVAILAVGLGHRATAPLAGAEQLVSLGWTGMAVIAIALLVGISALLRRFIGHPTLTLGLWIGILAYQLVSTPMDIFRLTPLHLTTLLTFAVLGSAFTRVRPSARPAATQPRRPNISGSWSMDPTPAPDPRLQWTGPLRLPPPSDHVQGQ